MTPDQIALLRDKAQLWRREAAQGNMELRDYNRRCADALEALLSQVPGPAPRQQMPEPDDRPEWELRTGYREEDFA